MSFDGHKGDMFVNRNPIIEYLVNYLNIKQESSDDVFEIIKLYGKLEKGK